MRTKEIIDIGEPVSWVNRDPDEVFTVEGYVFDEEPGQMSYRISSIDGEIHEVSSFEITRL